MKVVTQQLQGEKKAVLRAVAFTATAFFIGVAAFAGNKKYCQSQFGETAKSFAHSGGISADYDSKAQYDSKAEKAEVAGTAAELAPYSYGFYSQNYFLESIYARTPAAFALIS